MRLLWLVLAVGCAAGPRRVAPVDDDLSEREPPLATFRWALAPLSCEREQRSTVDTCQGRDSEIDDHLVAVYAPVDETDHRLTVLRYDGDHIGGPLRWQQHLELGSRPHSAVVVLVRDAAIVAAISEGAARVVAVDAVTGRVLGRATIVERGARAVQLEGIHDYARIHVRTETGGTVAVMHPRNARVIATREVSERSIFEVDTPTADAIEPTTEIDGVTLAWEQQRLVLRSAAWMRYVRAATHAEQRAHHRYALQSAGDRVIVTLQDIDENRLEVLAFDRATGTQEWRSAVTGSSLHAMTSLSVRSKVVDDQFVISNSGSLDGFVCSIGLADGVERACVDRVVRTVDARVFDFGDEIVTP